MLNNSNINVQIGIGYGFGEDGAPLDAEEVEVIGNIYETPELLKI